MSTHRSYKGIALIWVALMGIVFVGFVGLAIDTSFCLWAAHRLQIAADAAAMAGAQHVRVDVTATQNAAITVALANTAAGQPVQLAANSCNNPAGDIVVGVYNSQTQVFTPTLTSPNAVRVNARRTGSSLGGPLRLFFGPVFGINTVDITRSAVALSGGGGAAGMIVLDSSAPSSLSVTGNATITVTNGAIQVNSSNGGALRAIGNVTFAATETNVVGNASTTGNVHFNGSLNPGSSVVPDPLASLPTPTWNPASDKGSVNGVGNNTFNLQPGYYSGGISASGNTVINMAPGIYILGGAGINLTGNSVLNAQGVMLFITGTGSVNLTGNGLVTLTPPNPDVNHFPGADTYAGMTIFQDRANATTDAMTGNGNLNIQGTIYLSGARLTLVGNINTLGNQLIANQLRFVGNANVTIPYDGRNPLPGMKSWLVQ